MNFESLRSSWNSLQPSTSASDPLDEANLKKIMTKKYNRTFIKILIPELLLASGYLFLVVFLIAFFEFFESGWLAFLAVGAILLLLLIPSISLIAFTRYYRSGKLTAPVGDALARIQHTGQQFLKTQYLLFLLNLTAMADLVLLVPLVYSEHLSTRSKIIAVVAGAILLLVLSNWMWGYYKRRIERINQFANQLY